LGVAPSSRYCVAHPPCAPAHLGPMHVVGTARILVVLALIAGCLSSRCPWLMTYLVPAGRVLSLPTRAWQLAVGGLIALTAGSGADCRHKAAAITDGPGSDLSCWPAPF